MFNYAQPDGSIDEFVSQSFDLSNVDPNEGVTLTFRYAYRKRTSSDYEILRVYISSDCGENWSQRKILFGSQLGTEIATTSWTPESQDDWTTVHLTNITDQFWTENFRVKFSFESGGGNNLYIDDINLYDGAESDEILNIDDIDVIENFTVYPNPSAGEVNVSFATQESTAATIEVVDLVGKVISTKQVNTVVGQNTTTLAERLASGTYLVCVSLGDGSQQTKKLIVR